MKPTQPLYIRQEWIDASQFHDLTEAEVLREVHQRSGKVSRPVILLDLDSTLYEVGPRTFQILKEWCVSPESQAFPHLQNQLRNELRNHHVGYSLKDTLRAMGLSEHVEYEPGLALLKDFWAKRFFSNSYLQYDHAYPGAAHFTKLLYHLGAEIVYLTGRDEPNMGDGTRANLVRDQFPWDMPRTHLLMKPHSSMPDLDHKSNVSDFIHSKGELVASFENEPPNIVALHRIFPRAMHVFVETISSDHQAAPCEGLYRIKGFQAASSSDFISSST
jgi:hypothetical protein